MVWEISIDRLRYFGLGPRADVPRTGQLLCLSGIDSKLAKAGRCIHCIKMNLIRWIQEFDIVLIGKERGSKIGCVKEMQS
jgi:hypothetical protein